MALETIPILTVDVPLFTLRGGVLCAALQHRDRQPFKGRLALLGGFVHPEEDGNTRETALRILRQKADLAGLYLEQLMTFSGPDRDPRGWSASVAYYGLVPEAQLLAARDLVRLPVQAARALAVDH